jgi:formamidopyrimidine-DNA glycosylase
MPELPEVETVRRGLAPMMEGFRLTKAIVRRPDLRIPFPPRFAERLNGRRVLQLRRRDKYILADLDSGDTLVIHLGMSGRMTIYEGAQTSPANKDLGPHDHVIFETDAPARIIFTDHRRFGLMTLVNTANAEDDKIFAGMGPEPLSNAFNEDVLSAALKGKNTPIKSALLDQRVIAGLGNIYVCEALFRSHISPKRKAASVSGKRSGPLTHAIKTVLMEAIESGGSTLRDYAKADGSLGYFQHRFAVYDREDAPCSQDGCNGTITRIVQSGRSTFYCCKCQR